MLWRDVLREAGYLKSYRSRQFSGKGPDASDVQCPEIPEIHFEVKHRERLNARLALEQAMRDAGLSKIPVLAHKTNRRPWLITLTAEAFLVILGRSVLVQGGH